MSDRDQFYPLDRRVWLLAIGRRLRVEYDAIAEPMPPHLAALVKQLEMPAQGSGQETSKPVMACRPTAFGHDHRAQNAQGSPEIGSMTGRSRQPSVATGAACTS